jgi:hypothetical protein
MPKNDAQSWAGGFRDMFDGTAIIEAALSRPVRSRVMLSISKISGSTRSPTRQLRSARFDYLEKCAGAAYPA